MAIRTLGLGVVFFASVALVAVPLGRYMARVFGGENKRSARVLGPVERLIYKLAGVDPAKEHSWQQYAFAMLAFSALTMQISYVVMRAQAMLPGNPTGLSAVPEWLAFNTATSFPTNTNWQSDGGETTMSYLSQAVARMAAASSIPIARTRGRTRLHSPTSRRSSRSSPYPAHYASRSVRW